MANEQVGTGDLNRGGNPGGGNTSSPNEDLAAYIARREQEIYDQYGDLDLATIADTPVEDLIAGGVVKEGTTQEQLDEFLDRIAPGGQLDFASQAYQDQFMTTMTGVWSRLVGRSISDNPFASEEVLISVIGGQNELDQSRLLIASELFSQILEQDYTRGVLELTQAFDMTMQEAQQAFQIDFQQQAIDGQLDLALLDADTQRWITQETLRSNEATAAMLSNERLVIANLDASVQRDLAQWAIDSDYDLGLLDERKQIALANIARDTELGRQYLQNQGEEVKQRLVNQGLIEVTGMEQGGETERERIGAVTRLGEAELAAQSSQWNALAQMVASLGDMQLALEIQQRGLPTEEQMQRAIGLVNRAASEKILSPEQARTLKDQAVSLARSQAEQARAGIIGQFQQSGHGGADPALARILAQLDPSAELGALLAEQEINLARDERLRLDQLTEALAELESRPTARGESLFGENADTLIEAIKNLLIEGADKDVTKKYIDEIFNEARPDGSPVSGPADTVKPPSRTIDRPANEYGVPTTPGEEPSGETGGGSEDRPGGGDETTAGTFGLTDTGQDYALSGGDNTIQGALNAMPITTQDLTRPQTPPTTGQQAGTANLQRRAETDLSRLQNNARSLDGLGLNDWQQGLAGQARQQPGLALTDAARGQVSTPSRGQDFQRQIQAGGNVPQPGQDELRQRAGFAPGAPTPAPQQPQMGPPMTQIQGPQQDQMYRRALEELATEMRQRQARWANIGNQATTMPVGQGQYGQQSPGYAPGFRPTDYVQTPGGYGPGQGLRPPTPATGYGTSGYDKKQVGRVQQTPLTGQPAGGGATTTPVKPPPRAMQPPTTVGPKPTVSQAVRRLQPSAPIQKAGSTSTKKTSGKKKPTAGVA